MSEHTATDTMGAALRGPGDHAEVREIAKLEAEELDGLEIRGGPITLAGSPFVLYGFYLCAQGPRPHLVHLTEVVREVDLSPLCPIHGCVLVEQDVIRWDYTHLRYTLERLLAEAPELQQSLGTDYERWAQRLRNLLIEHLSDEALLRAVLRLVGDYGERSRVFHRQFLDRLIQERLIAIEGITQ